jgi:DNA polymerase, archaea type
MEKINALLLDVSSEDTKTFSQIKVFVKEKDKSYWLVDNNTRPYLYITVAENELAEKIEFLKSKTFGEEEYKIYKIEKTNKKMFDNIVLKIYFNKTNELFQARKEFNELGIQKYEYDIPYPKKYLIDNDLEPGQRVEIEKEGNEILSIKKTSGEFDASICAFDLETLFTDKFEVGREPILMASISKAKGKTGYDSRIISYNTAKVDGLDIVTNEEALLYELNKEINKFDLIITYNGDNFDMPYVNKRSQKYKKEFLINDEKIKIKRHGLDNAAEIFGKQHIDAYQIMKFLQRTGSINILKLDLENVSDKVFGIKKEKVLPIEINQAWQTKDKTKLTRLVKYNSEDAETTLRLAQEFLPLFIEISRLTSQTLSNSTRSSTSVMVEDLLLKETNKRGIVAPNKPHEPLIRERINNPIKGAFVKEPLAGLHENIAVLDFASLYPSVIISHNISPETLNCKHTECKKNICSDGTWFCTKEKGLFPEILEKMLAQRLAFKKEYKEKKKNGTDDKILFAKQWALKIILNSTYGYLGYPRARWYSRESASATTAWARQYIHQTSSKIEKEGFEILYNDTDSAVVLMGNKTKNDIEKLLKKINSELPDTMELELDGYYKRGIFVTKKEGGAAKKRYAFIDENDNLKIVGFEYVRRDWCTLAKETQKTVIELVLKKGEPEEAANFVRNVIKRLKEGKVPKEELTIITLLKRKIEDYDSIGPHVSAAKKAIDRGKNIGVGSLLSFIITKNGKTISEKAELEEFVDQGEYDSDYYIQNQILPAVIKILRELNYSEEDLIHGGKQTGLGAWF